ncbi:hypothetical protein [Streptomyces sp. NBC_01789]|uniref:hypothetical protein n=1 Tax=Streptomyces sp. NBC_01789 TaxID=2975941 RepID=UPI0022535997|nr:hypothetical protein [Streptomyces sp. NBC_01789]MCX4451728.1 hypothetical protein [Streptomyces sp. NBC_01789]
MHPTTTDAVFITPELVATARKAAALDQRMGGDTITTLTVAVGMYGTGFSLDADSAVFLDGPSIALFDEIFRPVSADLPASVRPASERRYAAAQELRRLLAALPCTRDALQIPLHAYAG